MATVATAPVPQTTESASETTNPIRTAHRRLSIASGLVGVVIGVAALLLLPPTVGTGIVAGLLGGTFAFVPPHIFLLVIARDDLASPDAPTD